MAKPHENIPNKRLKLALKRILETRF